MTRMTQLMTGAGLLALSTGLAAAAPAVVEQDLNLRAGPGVSFEVIAAMPAGATVDVLGCGAAWCRVAFSGTSGFANRGYLGLGGGVAAAPAYRTYGETYAFGGYAPAYGYDEYSYGYGPGYGYGGYSPGYAYGYYGNTGYRGGYRYAEGERGFASEGTVRGERTFENEGRVRGERTIENENRGRGERVGAANARGSSEEHATAIKGNNPMRIRESTANPNLSRAQGQPSAIKGNNPMRIRESTANPNVQRAQPTAIKGNNPMKVGTSSASGNARATTGAAPRERNR
jgi:uncharacterized protein YraI